MEDPLILSQADGRPMYAQIVEQIKLRIAVGDWAPGYRLPSIREMAAATRVSVITVKRAYQELEAEGLIITRQGMGSFVAEVDDLGRRMKEEEIDALLADAVEIAQALGMSAEDLAGRLFELLDAPDRKGKGKRK